MLVFDELGDDIFPGETVALREVFNLADLKIERHADDGPRVLRGLAMNELCRKIRSEILTISHKSGHGHIPTSFSIVEMLCAVYQTMRHDPKRPDMPDRDLFVLSKGHASLGFYCVLAGHGYFDFEDVYAFGAFDSKFGCHPDRTKVPGAEASTGSLGHGIGLAVGMALAAKIAGTPRRVYTLIGDGESNEGTVWEAIMVATNLKLDNLTVLYDHNHSQGRCLPIPNPAERFRGVRM